MASYRQKRALLIALTSCVWFANAALTAHRFGLRAMSGMKIQVQTSPQTVKIFVDGQPEAGGKYIQTPVTLVVAPGKRKIKIQREGFASQVMTVNGNSGDAYQMNQVVLGPMADTTFAAVRIEMKSPANAAMVYALDQGLSQGELPADVADLIVGRDYELTIAPAKSNSRKPFKCQFRIPESATPEQPYMLLVTKKAAKIRVEGCTPLAAAPAAAHHDDSAGNSGQVSTPTSTSGTLDASQTSTPAPEASPR